MMMMMMGGLFLAMGASAAPLAPLAPLAAVAPLADGRCGFKLGESKERCECVSKADAGNTSASSQSRHTRADRQQTSRPRPVMQR